MDTTKEKYCAACKHPESDHRNGGECTAQVKTLEPRFELCKCKQFVSKGEDFSRPAGRIVKEVTKD